MASGTRRHPIGRRRDGGDTLTEASGVPETPAAASLVFGEQLPLAEAFVRILADSGISRGLIGPREAPRLWDRHVLNCAVVHLLVPRLDRPQRVIDVGSGAGLPGLALAIARPDLELHLVEPLARRTAWLSETVAELGLANVTIHTARAEGVWGELDAPWVTARAVAGIVQLAEWTLPLLSDGGSLLALKGSKARQELEDSLDALQRLGVTDAAIEEVGGDVLAEPTTVLRLTVAHAVDGRTFKRKSPSSSGSARRRSDRPRRGQSGASRSAGRRPGGDEVDSAPAELRDAGRARGGSGPVRAPGGRGREPGGPGSTTLGDTAGPDRPTAATPGGRSGRASGHNSGRAGGAGDGGRRGGAS